MKAKRLISLLLVMVMCITALPVNVFAWSNKSHANSANIILLETQRSAKANNNKKANVTVYAPYDDHANGAYTYTIPEEFRTAIMEYPDAFRAGSLGPDFYPDLIAGQMIIHPYEEGMSSGEWITVLCDSVNILPQNSVYRKEALSFTLGCMLHYCGDLFGHDFINTFSGGSFPGVLDVLAEVAKLDYSGKNLNNVISHMSSESYMDKQVNWKFYNSIDYLDIAAPTKFVADTWIGNGSLYGGHTKLYDEYSELPPHFEYLIDWRTELYNEANEWRDNPDPTISAAATKYLDRWVEDQDKAIYALVETFDRIAARLVEEEAPDLLTVLKEEIKEWGLEYGIYISGIPDWMIDFPMAIDDFLEMIGIDLIDIDELIEELIEEAFLYYMGIPNEEELNDKILNRLKDASLQLDSSYNPYMKDDNNFAEFKQYMDKYAAEQNLLNGNSVSAILNGNDSGALDDVIDSDFEAFYNTMVMFKLILMGPDNFKTFVNKLSGKNPTVYNSQKTAHIAATGLEVEISTADMVNAGTDDNIYVVVCKIYDNGQMGRLTTKLLDKSYYNDFEAGNKDKYFVEIPEPVRLDRLEVFIEQKDTNTAGDFWKCDDVTITPVHAGIALTDPVSVGGNHDMDSDRTWRLRFQDALNARKNTDTKTQPVTTLKVRLKTGTGTFPGTDSDIYLEAIDRRTNDVWKSVLLDKPAYNDFEKGDDDTYIVPVTKYDKTTGKTEAIPFDQFAFRIRNSGSDEWYLYEMWVTPYNGNHQLTDTLYVLCDTHLEKDSFAIYPKTRLNDSNYKKLGTMPSFSYKTSLDDGLIKYVESIDGAAQWADTDNVLWKDPTIRKNVFFKIFKGFRPEINYTGTASADYYKPIDMKITLDAFWNGVRQERRNNVWDIAKMSPVNGVVTISFINEKGESVSSVTQTITNNQVTLNGYVDSKLMPGTYDVKVSYSASASNPMYADAEKTYPDALKIGGASSAITILMAEGINLPVIGKTPVKTATSTVTGADITKITWQYYDENESNPDWVWKVMPDGAVFEKGKRYLVTLRFVAKAGYTFASKYSEMTGIVNGKTAEIENLVYSNTECYVNYEFIPTEQPEFTVQPKSGEVAHGEFMNVTWETNFKPTRLSVIVEGAERAISLTNDQTSVELVSNGDKYYMLCAFYADGEFIVSDSFYITEKEVEVKEEEPEKPEEPVEELEINETPEEEPEEEVTPEAPAEKKFSDVKDSEWYYGDVTYAVQIGLINGKSETTYAPDDNLTYAEAIKLAACMHQLYNTGKVSLKNGDPWYQTYVDYCMEKGIIDKEYSYDEKATRAGYMAIFANALPDEALVAINDVPDNSIPDVPTMRAYSKSVYKLYRAGILQGVDVAHNCKPLDNIKRSEVAAILSRMMDKSKRVTFSMDK